MSTVFELQRLAQENSSDINVYLGLAREYYEAKEFDDASKMFKKALSLNRDNIEALNNFGALLFNKGNFDAAQVHFEIADELSPREGYSFKPLINYGFASFMLNETEKVKKTAEILNENISDNMQFNEKYVPIMYYLSGDLENTKRTLRNGVSRIFMTSELFEIFTYSILKTEDIFSAQVMFENFIFDKKDYVEYLETKSRLNVYEAKKLAEETKRQTQEAVASFDKIKNGYIPTVKTEPVII